ncbi:hypothetical protein GCM10011321_23450 [Youhaiella tibetensis]|uniref:Uncharacterized protein n=1 Tax=Paradevosia tibetensis TaxID=1447062 RepID=A0A5B9DLS5_9HYPH|nr:hypothetical protein [Youhaiella tibetensis]AKR54497.1 hypothetical protein XM25_01470 [Devosia sp. H5989]QEE19619.1 hypothetical protein FNA67_05270 [Youhaiella tibetensis]GGF31468.1 hypothetical protein GCM10011321_23450 [Youhaiella tibetensis]
MPNNKMSPAVRFAGAGLLALALAGCSMGNMFGGGGSTGAQFANATANPAQIAQAAPSALPAIATECPPIKVRPGSETLFSYAGQAGNPANLNWQAVIEKQSRNCVVSNGLITVKMGLVGRVVMGPKSSVSSVNLPVRFAVERDGSAIFSEKYSIPVAVTPPNQSEEFVKVVENVQIPYIGGEDLVIWVGFDPRG